MSVTGCQSDRLTVAARRVADWEIRPERGEHKLLNPFQFKRGIKNGYYKDSTN
jgi:hypothetical protein